MCHRWRFKASFSSLFEPFRPLAGRTRGLGLGTGDVRISIGKALAADALQRLTGPFLIVNPKRDAVAVAEIKLCQIAVQVLLSAVLIDALLGAVGGASAAVHGSWMDLLEFQLDTNHAEASLAPSFRWRNPRPQIGQTVAYLAAEAARDYFNFMGEGPIEFIDEKFDELSNRIRKAAQAHDSFLVSTNAP